MDTITRILILSCTLFLLFLMLTGCKGDEPKAKVRTNTFSMSINGKQWLPYQDPDNPCYSTFIGSIAGPGVYRISAYRDPSGAAEWWSENLLRMQVLNVTEPGIYFLEGTYKEDFDSYFMFQIRPTMDNYSRYVNDPTRGDFVVHVHEFLPARLIPSKGLRGSFYGILYNEDNPLDSLIIENGEFTFDYIGAGYERHCD